MKSLYPDIDHYLSVLPDAAKARLQEMREIIRKAAPEATETISYNMPAFRYKGKILVYFAAFKNHVSLFPGNSTLIKLFENDLKAYRTTKGTIHFELDKPVPADLVEKLVQFRVRENMEKASAKKNKK